jgi:hypothetical protein
MSTLKEMAFAGGASMVLGCGGVTPPPSTPEPSHDPSAEGEQEFSTIVARCEAVQQSRDLPVACQIDTVGDVARMQLTMADKNTAVQYLDAAFKVLAEPFCNLTRRVGRPAGVVLTLFEERAMRVANCSDGQFSDWQPADEEAQQLTSASRVCQALQASRYPVGCGMGEMDGVASLIVSYNKGQISEDGWGFISQQIAGPFCEATQASGVVAIVYLIEDNTRARGHNCATGAESAWLSIRPNARSTGSTRAPRRYVFTHVP